MYSNDFKLHVECIENFNQLMQVYPDSLKEILDLIFKWALVKLQDSGNTKFAVSIFDFLACLLSHLEDTQYILWDFEALVIVPLVCEKTGINNNILKDKVKKLLKMIYPIYDIKKTYLLIV
jgi:cytoskeleton-associated protein 5